MRGHAEYDVTIKEIHHTAKKDKPSGTAITLAEEIIKNNKLGCLSHEVMKFECKKTKRLFEESISKY